MAFSKRCTITVQSAQVPSTQTDFPVWIYASDTTLKLVANGGAVTDAQGDDVQVFSNAGLTSAVVYQRWFYDGTNGIWAGFAKISSLANGSIYYLGIGNASITTDSSSTAVWSTSFDRGAWPMSLDGTTINTTDFGPHAANGTNHGVSAAAGQVLGAGDFERSNNDYYEITDQTWNNMSTADFTIAAWVKRKSTGIFGGIASKMKSDDSAGFSMNFNSTNHVEFYAAGGGQTRDVISTGTYSSTSTWYFIVGVRPAVGSIAIYVQGSADGSTSGTVRDVNNTDPLVFGPYRAVYNANMNDAYMGPQRLGNFAATADFVTTMYNAESAPGTFASYVFDTPSSGTAFSRCIMIG